MKKTIMIFSLLVFIVISSFSVMLIEDYRNLKSFEYRVTTDEETFFYGAEIKKAGSDYEVKTWTTKKFPYDVELTESDIFASSIGSSFVMLFNPFYSQILASLDIDSLSLGFFFGFKVVDEGMEQVGKWNGKKISLQQDGEKILTWVINEDLGLVLKTTFIEDNTVIELVELTK